MILKETYIQEVEVSLSCTFNDIAKENLLSSLQNTKTLNKNIIIKHAEK